MDAAMARVDDSTLVPPPGTPASLALPNFIRALGWGLVAWAPVIVLLLAWEIFARSGAVTPFTLPAFSRVLQRMFNELMSGELEIAVGLTLWRALAGFVIAAVLGIILGLAMARVRFVYWFFDPIISIGFPIPKIAFLPIIVLWLGFFDVSKITMIAFNTIFPIVTATVVGVYGVEKEIIWSARNLGTSERAMLWEILLPAALPQIFTGLQVALPIALIVGVLTEMAMGGYGVGGSMQTASRMADSLGVFAGIIEIAIVGYAMVKLMAVLRHRLLIWHQEAQEPTTV
jgi:ABC-type nitrate/sulfonate/bicarbonate transport system permease component